NERYSYASSFFFQAEDVIRDFHVTGVQTCALPIFDRGDDADVVAGADPAVGAVVAEERARQALGERRDDARRAELVLAVAGVHAEVVRVHVVAGGDRGRGQPDRLPVRVQDRKSTRLNS